MITSKTRTRFAIYSLFMATFAIIGTFALAGWADNPECHDPAATNLTAVVTFIMGVCLLGLSILNLKGSQS
jgi:hypothetical protein